MTKMLKLREELQKVLKTATTNVYFQLAPDDAAYPYIVFDLPNSFLNERVAENFTLEIDGWDDNNNTTALETMMQNAFDKIDRKTFNVSDDLFIRCYIESRLSIPDPDTRIRRRKQNYICKTIIK